MAIVGNHKYSTMTSANVGTFMGLSNIFARNVSYISSQSVMYNVIDLGGVPLKQPSIAFSRRYLEPTRFNLLEYIAPKENIEFGPSVASNNSPPNFIND